MRIRFSLLLLAILPGIVLTGCGGPDDDAAQPGPTRGQLAGAATVGADSCVLCHLGTTPERASAWLGGKHANSDFARSGPDGSYAADPDPADHCVPCHNPLGDGARLASISGRVAAPYSLQVDRPLIGCESCHGGGGLHLGNWAIAYPRADSAKCVLCHYLPATVDGSFQQLKGATVVTLALPGHGLSVGDAVTLDFTSPATGVPADGNYVATAIPDADSFQVAAAAAGKDVIGSVHVRAPDEDTYLQSGTTVTVTRARHGLAAGQRVALQFTGGGPANGIYAVTAVPDPYSFTVTAPTGSASGSVTIGDAHTFAAPLTVESRIADSHFDTPLTNASANSRPTLTDGRYVEGYVVRKGGGGCNDCHDAHSADLAIQREWAQSAHGGRILTRKLAGLPGAVSGDSVYDATRTAVIQTLPFPAVAWFSNWDQTYQASDSNADGIFDAVSEARASCQRCHTATGVANFLSDPAGYDPKENDYSHLSGWQFTWQDVARTLPGPTRASDQNELLYCWGCHSNASSGALRNPGALTLSYTNGATASYPDVAGSNVCIACHSGRETGDSVKLDPADGSNRSFISSHYFTGGGTVFGQTGYEYAGRDYEDLPYFKHKGIGISEADTGSNGPCVGCHMSRPQSHLFIPVSKDPDSGAITSVDTPLCATCHFGADMVTVLNTAKEGYADALQLLTDALALKGIHYYDGRYYRAPYVSGGTNTSYANWAGPYGSALWKETMGAAFNLTLLAHDGGGYVHNRIYAKRLLFDAIDFIGDGALDGAILVDETLYPAAAVWFAADPATNRAVRP